MPSTLTEDVAHRLGISPDAAQRALRAFSDDIKRQVQETGSAKVDGLGAFQKAERGLTFDPSNMLAQAVNRRFADLEVLIASPAEPDASTTDAPSAADAPGSQDTPPEAAHPGEPRSSVPPSSTTGEEAAREEAAREEASPTTSPATERARAATEPEEDQTLSAPSRAATWTPHAVLSANVAQAQGPVESQFVGAKLLPADAAPAPSSASSAQRGATPASASWQERPQDHRAPARRGRRSVWPWLAGAAALLVVAVVAWLLLSRPNEEPAPSAATPPVASSEEEAPPSPAALPSGQDTASASAAETPSDTARAAPAPPPEPLAPLGIEQAAGTWVIVVSSETARADAEPILSEYRRRLSALPFALDIVESTTDAGLRYRVAVGPFDSFTTARAALQEYTAALPEGAWLLEADGS